MAVLLPAISGCGAGREGPSGDAAGKALAGTIVRRNERITDAVLAGRFLLESPKGSTKGSLRIRYLSPDIYRVDVIAAGVPGAAGGSSFLVEGDSTLVYVSGGGEAEIRSIEEVGVVTFLRDFDLALADLKALVAPGAYLDLLSPAGAGCKSVRGGYLMEGYSPHGDLLAVWIDKDKGAVVKSVRSGRSGLPIVETRLERFERVEGVWRPMRRTIRHFGQEASLAVQYDVIRIDAGLDREDLQIRTAGSGSVRSRNL